MLRRKMSKKRRLLGKKEILKSVSNRTKESLTDLVILDTTGSTNDEAKKKLSEIVSFNQSYAVFSEQQLSGRGRSGKKWVSPANLNIYFSLAWKSLLKPSELEGLSLSVAVVVSKKLKPILTESLKIKWPNDLFIGGKKVGGILVETSSNQEETGIVVGVGLNVLMSDKEGASIDQDWTSLNQHQEKDLSRNLIAGLVLDAVLELKSNFEEKGFCHYKALFEEVNLLKNSECVVTFDKETLTGKVVGVTDKGELIFTENEKTHHLRYGEVSLRKI